LFKNQRIEVIENPIRSEFFVTESANSFDKEAPNQFRKPGEALVLTAVASDLTNPAKGIAELVKIFKEVRGGGDRVRLQLVGGRGDSFHNPASGVYWLGLADASAMVQIARQTHLLVSASTAESAGLIVREFGSLGVPTLALRSGGIEDLIEDGVSGFLASDLSDLSLKLGGAVTGKLEIRGFEVESKKAAIRNKPEKVSEAYLNAYKSLD
jgi:glycosyltransferase involved in cell wall biosynthesis